jgi:hypothetical protein
MEDCVAMKDIVPIVFAGMIAIMAPVMLALSGQGRAPETQMSEAIIPHTLDARPAPYYWELNGQSPSVHDIETIWPKMMTAPDKSLTPGDILSHVKAKICHPGYASGVRDVSIQEKKEVFSRYKTEYVPDKYEVDHLVPLCAGGSNNITNLWPQPLVEAKIKDEMEWKVCHAVCAGKMTLEDAQAQFMGDFRAHISEYLK